MKKEKLILVLLALSTLASLSGAAYFRQQSSAYKKEWLKAEAAKRPSAPVPKQQHRPPAPVPTPETQDLENEKTMADLLAELEEKEILIAELRKAAENQKRPREFPSSEERKQRMEEFKEKDPKAYEEMVQRREEMKQRIQNAFAMKASTLLERDTSDMSEEELAQYEQMLSLFNQSWQLTEKMTSGEVSREERTESFQEMREISKELQPLLQDERQRRFQELAEESGYSADDAEAFADYINKTIQATSMPGGGPRPGRRPR